MNKKRTVAITATILVLASSLMLTTALEPIQIDAEPGQGVSVKKYGSGNTKVCGDRLCSEPESQESVSTTNADNEDDDVNDNDNTNDNTNDKNPQMQHQDKSENKLKHQWSNVHSNVETTFNEKVVMPTIASEAFIHPFAVVIGNCHIGKMVFVAPTAVCRGDEGTPIHVGDGANMQDGVVIHALETVEEGHNIDDRRFSADGDRLKGDDPAFADGHAVHVGNNVSLAHGSMIHGPAWIGDNTFVGMEALVFNAKIGSNVAVGVSATITGGVEIPDDKFVPPGAVITMQEQADALLKRIGSPYEGTNDAVLNVNQQLAEEYDTQMDLEKLIMEREKIMEKGMWETSMPHP